jgi:hypothetical protein
VGSRQWAVGSKQWAVGSGQWAVGSKQWAVGSKQWAAGNRVFGIGIGIGIGFFRRRVPIPIPIHPGHNKSCGNFLLLILNVDRRRVQPKHFLWREQRMPLLGVVMVEEF